MCTGAIWLSTRNQDDALEATQEAFGRCFAPTPAAATIPSDPRLLQRAVYRQWYKSTAFSGGRYLDRTSDPFGVNEAFGQQGPYTFT